MDYVYKGPEVIVGKFKACGIQEFRVHESDFNESMTASGTIQIMDYIENCPAEHKWQAKKVGGEWVVWCDDKPWKYSLIEEHGHVGFTWESSINQDMKKFIAEQLSRIEA